MKDKHTATVFSINQEYTLLSSTSFAEGISSERGDRHFEEICHLQKRPGVYFYFSRCGMHRGQYQTSKHMFK